MAPDFTSRRSLTMGELLRLEEPACLYEHFLVDSDGQHAYVYSVGGRLDDREIAGAWGGCTIGDEVMIIHADSREEADRMACDGLELTIAMERDRHGSDHGVKSEVIQRSRIN